jgi:hypothetical protein
MQQRRRQPRAQVQLDCVLTRAKGSPISCQTIDVGPGGMRVATDRPLGVDEVLHFDLPVRGTHVGGDARVLREQGPNVYALRFEAMGDEAVLHLGTLTFG